MEKMKQIGIALMVLMLPAVNGLFAQSSPGEIQGKVFDKKDVPSYSALIWVESKGDLIKTGVDDDGRFVLKPLDAGNYTVHVKNETDTFKFNVTVNSNEIFRLPTIDFSSEEFKSTQMDEFTKIHYIDPLIRIDQASMEIMRAKELEHSPAKRDIRQIIGSQTSGVKVTESGDAYVRGSRADAIIYFVDGVKLLEGFKSPPASAISSVAVYTGGVPAKYGDCTGGVVVVETKNYFSLYNEWKAKQASEE